MDQAATGGNRAKSLLTIPLLVITFRASLWTGIALIPYQLWVTTATVLSFSYSKLN